MASAELDRLMNCTKKAALAVTVGCSGNSMAARPVCVCVCVCVCVNVRHLLMLHHQ